MRILIAPDSFKNALRNIEVASALAQGWHSVRPTDTIECFPLSDGGEGFCNTLKNSRQDWQNVTMAAHDPIMRPLDCQLLKSNDGKTAAFEMAAASGLELLSKTGLAPLEANTFGTGEILKQLIEAGCRTIWLGIGGSATTDGGAGALLALGAKYYAQDGTPIVSAPGGGVLSAIARVDLSEVRKLLDGVEIQVACDVTNPLCGPRGSAAVFSPQKGATAEQVRILDENLGRWAQCFGSDGNFSGAGAAGGLGFMLSQIGAKLRPGAELLIQASGLVSAMKAGADLLITGEGKSDRQTLDGKLCATVARMAADNGIPTALLSGAIPDEDQEILQGCFKVLIPISQHEKDLPTALAHTQINLCRAAAELARSYSPRRG